MPSGRTHAAITILAAAGLAAYSGRSGQPLETTLAISGGCLTGILVNPDLDVDRPTRSHYVMLRYGWLAYSIWYLIWYPYARLFSHRSFWTHTPVISTLIRAGYLLGLAWLALRLLHIPWPGSPDWALLATIGLIISDALHWLSDVLVSWLKRKNRHKARVKHPL